MSITWGCLLKTRIPRNGGQESVALTSVPGTKTWPWYDRAPPPPTIPLSFRSWMNGLVHRGVLFSSSHSTSFPAFSFPTTSLPPPPCLWECWFLKSSSRQDFPRRVCLVTLLKLPSWRPRLYVWIPFYLPPADPPFFADFFLHPVFLSFRLPRVIEVTVDSIFICSIVIKTVV